MIFFFRDLWIFFWIFGWFLDFIFFYFWIFKKIPYFFLNKKIYLFEICSYIHICCCSQKKKTQGFPFFCPYIFIFNNKKKYFFDICSYPKISTNSVNRFFLARSAKKVLAEALYEQKFSNLKPHLSITFPQGFRIS